VQNEGGRQLYAFAEFLVLNREQHSDNDVLEGRHRA
jgi:hypothetical protein